MNINSIILVSHGELSQGMKQTVAMIIGSENNIYALSAFRDEDEPINEQIEKLLTQIGTENVYILTDILGGSVNNGLLEIQQKYPKLNLITGMNLPLVITLATQMNLVTKKQLALIVEESRQSLVDCKELLIQEKASKGDEL